MVINDPVLATRLLEIVRARDAAAAVGDDTCPAFEVELRIFDAETRRAWLRGKVIDAMSGQLES